MVGQIVAERCINRCLVPSFALQQGNALVRHILLDALDGQDRRCEQNDHHLQYAHAATPG
jgi:hypothetical protein